MNPFNGILLLILVLSPDLLLGMTIGTVMWFAILLTIYFSTLVRRESKLCRHRNI
jgi:hypothetical protein